VFRKPLPETRVRVEFLFDDVEVYKEGVILDHDAKQDVYLVRTDWGEDWFHRSALEFPGAESQGVPRRAHGQD
jgi:hypothetical protein